MVLNSNTYDVYQKEWTDPSYSVLHTVVVFQLGRETHHAQAQEGLEKEGLQVSCVFRALLPPRSHTQGREVDGHCRLRI